MKWEKLGKICDCNSFSLDWYKKNTMTPLPFMKQDGILRVYLTMCDSDNQGSIGYIDVQADNPTNILGYSTEPVLGLGEKGTFDENGVLPTSLLEEDGLLYLHYSAYQRQVSCPYTILSGLAVSSDGGDTFTRVHRVPILDRTDDELFQRSAVEIMKIDDKYRIWYSCGSGWINKGEKEAPKYDIHTMTSERQDLWLDQSETCMQLVGDEYGLTMPQVWRDDENYCMLYSVRSFSKGYRMGYAESMDGVHFVRKDNLITLDVSEAGFDSEMICFGKIYKYRDAVYMLYCGNHYGIGGLGVARLIH